MVTGLRASLVLLCFASMRLPAAAQTSISASEARLFVGEEKVIEDTVTAGERDGNTVRLQLGRQPQHLTVALVVGLLSHFPPNPERYYVGKTVRVAGMIASFRGAPEIVVRDVGDIQVVEMAPRAGGRAMAAASSADDTSTEQRLKALGERVQLLEQRVQQLEGAPARSAAP